MTALSDAIKSEIEAIDKEFGVGTLQQLGSKTALDIEAVSTRSITLDRALGVGGLPRGRLVEVFGPESSGKTTLVYHVLAEAQSLGGTCAFIDAEHALDPSYAKTVGVNTDELLISQPDYGEQALEVTDRLVQTGEVAVVAVDSIDAITPRAILDGEMGEASVAALARLMSQACRKLARNASRSGCLVLFTNQIREVINALGYGPKEFQPGGRALKFYASQRIDLRRIETLKHAGEAVGNRVRAKVVKNKVAPPFQEAEFDIDYGLGFSRPGELIDLGIDAGCVKKSGSWFSYGDTKLGQGRPGAKAFLRENPEVADEIEEAIK